MGAKAASKLGRDWTELADELTADDQPIDGSESRIEDANSRLDS